MKKKNVKKSMIKSEFSILVSFIVNLLLMPFRFVMALFGKESFSRVFTPFFILKDAIVSAKFTFFIISFNFLLFFASLFINNVDLFVLFPSDLLNPSRWFSFVTHGFLHANFVHLFGNSLALFIFGRIVEKELGPHKTSVVYFSALIFAGVFSSVINLLQGSNVGGIGASGAIMGLVSAAILLKPFKITFAAIIPLPVIILGWLMIYADLSGLFNNLQDGIGYGAHIGGFLSALLLFIILKSEKRRLWKGLLVNIFTLTVFFLAYFLFF